MRVVLTVLFWVLLPFVLKHILASFLMPICVFITIWLLVKWL